MVVETLEQLADHVRAGLAGAAQDCRMTFQELTLIAQGADLVRVLTFLRDDPECEFKILIDICGVDYPQRAKRFDVVYHLLSISKNRRIRVKVEAADNEAVPSCVALYPAANWFERETFDMFGIAFSDHPDLRRLLTDYGFSGYPLRKDFPLTGYVEVRWDDEEKRVVYEPVKLVQEFRDFDFLSPWEGARYIMLPGDDKAKAQKGERAKE